ncbi:MAG: glycine--tRNA ligase [Flavobacteriales bacterium AspAUS03]
MKNSDNIFRAVISHAKAYGFVFSSSEIYDGLSAVYDYGQYGVVLKNNIKEYWWKAMVQLHENIVGIDAAIFMHPTTWKASGHVDAFSDPLIDNKDSKRRYRSDVLIEEYAERLQEKIEKEVDKARKRIGTAFNEAQFLTTHPKVITYRTEKEEILTRMSRSLEAGDLADVKALIDELGITDPDTGSKNWTNVRQFNLMFQTQLGSLGEGATDLYLRPETAQGIFVNFSNVQKTGRMKIPFGIAQIGKAFRNEIIARQFTFRMREFEQMEMQFFVTPGQEMKWYTYWKEARLKWHLALGLGVGKYRFHDHEKLSHYANAATDIEFRFPFGFKELEGIHSRTDFDLKRHEAYSRKKLQYFDSDQEQHYIPYVVETSVGLDRMFLAVFASAFEEESLENGITRLLLRLPPALAPVKAAILPLVKKNGLPEMAEKIFHMLRLDHQLIYEEKESIGKRYRRQDAIGTPICITVDHESLQDQFVTVRFRDTMEQKRVPIKTLSELIEAETGMRRLLKALL